MASDEIHIPMPIVTERLLLRPLQAGDRKIIHEAKRESWSELLPWLVWIQKPLEELTVADDEAFCLKKTGSLSITRRYYLFSPTVFRSGFILNKFGFDFQMSISVS